MKFKSRPDIPKPILRALQNDRYEQDLMEHFEDLPKDIKHRYSFAISVTTLPRAPRQLQLATRHDDEIEIDPEERSHALLGRVVHTILEQFKEPWQIAEERLGIIFPVKVDGVVHQVYIHGAADLYDPKTGLLEDYKTPKTAALRMDRSEKVAQLNILGYIWRKHKRKVTALKNDYLLLKDYDPRKIKEGSEYPTSRFPTKEAPLWSDKECEAYLTEHITAHLRNLNRPDDELDPCTDVERWKSEDSFGVYKEGAEKMAKAWAGSMIEAQERIEELEAEEWQKLLDYRANLKKKVKTDDELNEMMPKFLVKTKLGTPRRCAFCEGQPFCNVRQSELALQLTEGETHPEEDEA